MSATDSMIETEQHRPEESGPDPRRWAALAVVVLAALLDGLDATVVTVVLPVIQRDVGADFAAAQWTLAGYAFAFALLLITGGRLGDIYGMRRVFLAGVAGFTAASLLCAVAWSAETLVLGRFAQGATAALMVPQVVAVIVTMFPRERWPVAFGILGGVLSVGTVGGPLLGGLLTEANLFGLGWRAIFLMNLPLCLAALVAAARLLPERRADSPTRVDGTGVLLLSLAAGALMFPLVQGRELGWPIWLLALLVLSVPLFGLFAVSQRRRQARDDSALVPPRLFRSRSFRLGLVATFLVFTGVGSLFLVLTYHLQFGLGWSPLRTALATAAWPLGIAATFQIAWRKGAGRERHLVGVGASIMAAGALTMLLLVDTLGADLELAHVAAAGFVLGCGMGLVSPVLTALVLGEVPPADTGAGSGVVNAVIQFGSAAGVALLGTLYFALVEAGRESFPELTSTALWYNVAAFVATAAMSRLLAGPSPAETPVT
ncbi:MFS transporter [Micromonospora sp. C31]|uniref:MFS transporter n=1 Tax=Micromonospora sp. C31 TaxID=2824876 RepID=UPI001B38D1C5|nr:MFS transporter [Micromonospora sp. C31]MBQ1074904.1 MFS transporter [Micromonospora sp. C31]